MGQRQLIRLTEGDLHKIINETVKSVLSEEGYPQFDDVYAREQGEEDETRPLKNNVSLYHVRQRLGRLMQMLNNNDVDNAKSAARDLFGMVDAMINQGF